MSLVVSVLLIIAGIVVSYFSIIYATGSASNSVTDIILSNIRVFDVDGFFIYGPLVFWFIILIYLLSEPRKIPFTFKTIALFLFIRSIFVSLTHIGPFPEHVQTSITGVFSILVGEGKDLFFSSHTGLPFLMALVFWNDKHMRYFSLISSFFFGAVVLLAHLHYSIDVFAAFFITYSIFHIALKFFQEDYNVFSAMEESF